MIFHSQLIIFFILIICSVFSSIVIFYEDMQRTELCCVCLSCSSS